MVLPADPSLHPRRLSAWCWQPLPQNKHVDDAFHHTCRRTHIGCMAHLVLPAGWSVTYDHTTSLAGLPYRPWST